MLKIESTASATGHGHPASVVARGRDVIQIEADALMALRDSLDECFDAAVQLLTATKQRVIVSGMGKSGHIARKIAATLASTGTPALYVHPAEAAHGDLGMMMSGDILLILSNSGATPELKAITDHAKSLNCKIIGIASYAESPLMRMADVKLLLPMAREACPVNIAPTTSTTLMLALGDALAVATMSARGFTRERFKVLHPGGQIGNRLASVDDVMHVGDALPLVDKHMPMPEVLVIMTAKSFGIAGVVDDDGKLLGIITDGDLRRNSDTLFAQSAGEVMTAEPKLVAEGTASEDALSLMSAHRITAMFVTAYDEPRQPVGLVHIHDFVRMGLC